MKKRHTVLCLLLIFISTAWGSTHAQAMFDDETLEKCQKAYRLLKYNQRQEADSVLRTVFDDGINSSEFNKFYLYFGGYDYYFGQDYSMASMYFFEAIRNSINTKDFDEHMVRAIEMVYQISPYLEKGDDVLRAIDGYLNSVKDDDLDFIEPELSRQIIYFKGLLKLRNGYVNESISFLERVCSLSADLNTFDDCWVKSIDMLAQLYNSQKGINNSVIEIEGILSRINDDIVASAPWEYQRSVFRKKGAYKTNIGDNSSALLYFEKALRLSIANNACDDVFFGILESISNVNFLTPKDASCVARLDSIISSIPPSTYSSIDPKNIIKMYYYQGIFKQVLNDYKHAREYLELVKEEGVNGDQDHDIYYMSACFSLSNIYCTLGDFNAAEKCLRHMLVECSEIVNIMEKDNPMNTFQYYSLLEEIYKEKGDSLDVLMAERTFFDKTICSQLKYADLVSGGKNSKLFLDYYDEIKKDYIYNNDDSTQVVGLRFLAELCNEYEYYEIANKCLDICLEKAKNLHEENLSINAYLFKILTLINMEKQDINGKSLIRDFMPAVIDYAHKVDCEEFNEGVVYTNVAIDYFSVAANSLYDIRITNNEKQALVNQQFFNRASEHFDNAWRYFSDTHHAMFGSVMLSLEIYSNLNQLFMGNASGDSLTTWLNKLENSLISSSDKNDLKFAILYFYGLYFQLQDDFDKAIFCLEELDRIDDDGQEVETTVQNQKYSVKYRLVNAYLDKDSMIGLNEEEISNLKKLLNQMKSHEMIYYGNSSIAIEELIKKYKDR